MNRYGMTIPFDGVPLGEQADWIRELVDLGYTDVWSSEANGADAFTPLVLASVWAPTLRLGSAIVPAFTRGPACMAQSIASLASAAPGRAVLGLGTSSNVIVEGWNGIPFEEPYRQVQSMLRFLRQAMAGEKVTGDFGRFSVRGFTLGIPVTEPVPILIGALREGMLRLAGREGDGAIINWLSADDVSTVAPIVQRASVDGSPKEIVARIFVAPTTDRDLVMRYGKFAIAFGIKSGTVLDLRAEVESNLKLELKRKLEGLLKDQAMKGLRANTQLTLPKSLVDLEAVQLMRRMAANLEQQGMKADDIKLTPDLFRPQAEERVALGLILGELVRKEGLQAKPEQVMSMVKDVAQTYEQPEAVVRWHFEKPERLNDFEGLAVERNVVDWVLGKAQVKDVPTTFEALMGNKPA